MIDQDLAVAMTRPPVRVHEVVVGVLKDACGNVLARTEGHNFVPDAGALYYAERGVADLNAGTPVPTNFTDVNGTFDGIVVMGDATTPTTPGASTDYSDISPISGATKTIESGYPKVNDTDPDNSGAGAGTITYKYVFTTTGTYTGITELVITNPSPGTGEPLLSHSISSDWTPSGAKSKTTSQTLTWYINHTPAGA